MDDHVEQYSPESARRLREATAALTAELDRFVEGAAGMHGGSAEMPTFFALADAVSRAVVDWQERAADHIGAYVLPLDADLDHLEDDEDEEDDGPVEITDAVSVVSRWDLGVVDVDALVAAGRAAHRRMRPEEDDADTAVAVDGPATAVQALLHEQGEPWYEVDGLQVLHGARVFLRPDAPAAPEVEHDDEVLDPFLDDPVDAVLPPPGEVVFSEGWA
jgi:hypothetical protein